MNILFRTKTTVKQDTSPDYFFSSFLIFFLLLLLFCLCCEQRKVSQALPPNRTRDSGTKAEGTPFFLAFISFAYSFMIIIIIIVTFFLRFFFSFF